MLDLDGIGETQIQSINSFFSNETNLRITNDLINQLNIRNYSTKHSGGKFSNKRLMFTGGFQNMSRSEAKTIVEEKMEGKFLERYQKNSIF